MQIKKTELQRLYDNHTMKEICQILGGVSRSEVYSALKQSGIELTKKKKDPIKLVVIESE